jgi:organic radical activating enzyme
MTRPGIGPREVMQAWGRILAGDRPNLSIEITKECPLRCPGCYAYGDEHLGGDVTLRGLSDYKGDELVSRFMALIDRHRPLHVSIVGGEPLVRYRELSRLLPQLEQQGVHTQVVTSAVRRIPIEWSAIPKLNVVVSVDGLQPEHDARRKPATYERILESIAGHRVTVHCTVTRQMTTQPGYVEQFLEFWSARPEVRKIWFSIFTPQIGENPDEVLAPFIRGKVIDEISRLRLGYPKLEAPEGMLDVYRRPPADPSECVFAAVTRSFTADLERPITPCQFGGKPDCSQCGCVASAGLTAVARHRLPLAIEVGKFFWASIAIGNRIGFVRERLARVSWAPKTAPDVQS